MNRFLAPRLLLQNGRSMFQVLSARYSVDTGSKAYIDDLIKDKKVVVFMKGIPGAERCGFSQMAVKILQHHGVKEFDYHDVLEDQGLRQGIKDYSNWPTIPQVYIGEEFIGGTDVLLEMHKNGELIEELEKVGIKSALLDSDTDSDQKS